MINTMNRTEAEEALAESIALEDLGKVVDIRSRVRTGLVDVLDKVTRRCREIADGPEETTGEFDFAEGSADAPAAEGSGPQRTLRGW